MAIKRRLGWSIGKLFRSVGNNRIRSRRKRMEMHQLDVKLNSRRSVKVRRVRRKASVIKILAIACLVVSAALGLGWAYRNIFFENSEFRLNRLVIETDGTMTESDIASGAGVHAGMNLMEIDLVDVREKIGAMTMVSSANVRRELPDRLVIEVNERVAVAWLSCPPHGIRPRNTDRGFLIDREGQVFRCQQLDRRFLVLPVIETSSIPKPAAGTMIESVPVVKALELLEKSNLIFGHDGLEVAEINLMNSFSMRCVYNDAMDVEFGLNDIDRGLEDLRQIVVRSREAGRDLATVNLLVTRNIPVTFYNPPDPSVLLKPATDEGAVIEEPKAQLNPAEKRKQEHLRSILKGG